MLKIVEPIDPSSRFKKKSNSDKKHEKHSDNTVTFSSVLKKIINNNKHY